MSGHWRQVVPDDSRDDAERESKLRGQRTTAELSSRERSQVNDAMIAQIGALSRRMNELTALENDHSARIVALEKAQPVNDRLHIATSRQTQEFIARPFLARLRWLVTGR